MNGADAAREVPSTHSTYAVIESRRDRPRLIADLQPGNLDRVFERHVLQQLERDAVRGVLETAVALAVPNDIGRGLLANRQRGGAPEFAVVFVANVDHFARPVADRIVGPRRELILLAVDRPRIAAAFDRDLEAEGRVGDDVDPGRRRPLPLAEDRHVFAPVVCEAAKAIEEFELRAAAGAASRHSVSRARRLGGGATAAADSSRRLTCSKRLPRRLKSTARATLWSRLRASGETSSARRTNTVPARALLPDDRRDWLARTSASRAVCRSCA